MPRRAKAIVRLGPVIAARRLRVRGSRRTVLVRLGKPRRAGRDWRAPVQIRGAGSSELLYGYGVDAMQAVIDALEGIRVTLAKRGHHLTWVGGSSGDTGFPRVVPDIGSPQLRQRIEHLIDREVERFVQALERKHRRRHPQGASAPRRVPGMSRRAP
jgi:hypothetical protein